jgi:hypothetical protein
MSKNPVETPQHFLLQFPPYRIKLGNKVVLECLDSAGCGQLFPRLLREGGGYVTMNGAALDNASPENVKIWIDFTKEYGVYR